MKITIEIDNVYKAQQMLEASTMAIHINKFRNEVRRYFKYLDTDMITVDQLIDKIEDIINKNFSHISDDILNPPI